MRISALLKLTDVENAARDNGYDTETIGHNGYEAAIGGAIAFAPPGVSNVLGGIRFFGGIIKVISSTATHRPTMLMASGIKDILLGLAAQAPVVGNVVNGVFAAGDIVDLGNTIVMPDDTY
ncbi:MAG: hypothetical protein R3C68_02120 [Myxococcota bacterium]